MATTLAQAIAQIENTNPAYNNPGAISGTGDTGTSFGAGIGIYSSLASGQAALNAQLQSIYSGASKYYNTSQTLDQFGTIYSGGNSQYGSMLASKLGVPSSTTLGQLNGTSTAPQTGILGAINKGMDYLDSLTGAPNADNPEGKYGKLPFLPITFEDLVTIIVGIILIAAGLFAFKQTQTVIEQGGKIGKKALELAS